MVYWYVKIFICEIWWFSITPSQFVCFLNILVCRRECVVAWHKSSTILMFCCNKQRWSDDSGGCNCILNYFRVSFSSRLQINEPRGPGVAKMVKPWHGPKRPRFFSSWQRCSWSWTVRRQFGHGGSGLWLSPVCEVVFWKYQKYAEMKRMYKPLQTHLMKRWFALRTFTTNSSNKFFDMVQRMNLVCIAVFTAVTSNVLHFCPLVGTSLHTITKEVRFGERLVETIPL